MRTTDARPHSLPIRKMKVAASFGSSPGQRDGDCAGPVACRLASRAWTVMCRRHVGVTARERLTGQSGNVRCFHGVLENVTAEDAPVRTKMRGEIRKTACEFVAAKLL